MGKKRQIRLCIFFITLLFTVISCGGAGNNGESEGASLRISIQFPSISCLTESTKQEASTRQTTEDIIKTIVLTVTGNDFSTIEETFNIGEQIRVFVPVGNDRNFMIEGFDEFGQLVCRGGITSDVLPGLNTLIIQCIAPTPTPTPSPTPTPTPPPLENCFDGIDNDGDNLTDCADPECEGQIGPQGQICEIPEVTCNDGADNDGDNLTDCADPSCVGQVGGCVELCEQPEETCYDRFDNDGDGRQDCTDTDCEGQRGPQEQLCEIPEQTTCDDDSDNDGDDLVDCEDPSCEGQIGGPLGQVCEAQEATCDDRFDNDADELTDCSDPDCFEDPSCFIF
ncbi:MAG: hypothetical protein HYW01_05470 [Deltaproteobacteria bacterium]|nr:hypothetical protein [Deltaproteobacteria bacterium]